MGGVAIQEALDHLRIDEMDDALYVQGLVDVATDHVGRYLNRELPWTDSEGSPVETPASVRHAILLLVADLYEHRTSTVEGVRVRDNPTAMRLLDLYREGIGV